MKPLSPFQRFAATAATLLYFFGCIIAALFASSGEPSSVRMAFVVFGFVFFLFGFLSFFYHIANFSEADRQNEARQLKPDPPPPLRMIAYTILGVFWASILLWLLLWRF